MSRSKEIFTQVRSQELEDEKKSMVDVPAHLRENIKPVKNDNVKNQSK